MATVNILRNGNIVTLDAADPALQATVEQRFQFTVKRHLFGRERKVVGMPVVCEVKKAYFRDHKKRISLPL